MLGMSLQEIFIILAIAVLVIGPDQLPKVARTIGKLVAQFRRASNDLRNAVQNELGDDADFKEFRELTSNVRSVTKDVGSTARDYFEKQVEEETRQMESAERDLKQEADAAVSAWKEASREDEARREAVPNDGDPGPLEGPAAEEARTDGAAGEADGAAPNAGAGDAAAEEAPRSGNGTDPGVGEEEPANGEEGSVPRRELA